MGNPALHGIEPFSLFPFISIFLSLQHEIIEDICKIRPVPLDELDCLSYVCGRTRRLCVRSVVSKRDDVSIT